MTIDELQKNKYAILLEALLMGIPLCYDEGWDLVFCLKDNILYEAYYQRPQGKDVIRKSTLTLNEFLKHYKKISNENLKTIFGNIKLHKLQRRLIEENK